MYEHETQKAYQPQGAAQAGAYGLVNAYPPDEPLRQATLTDKAARVLEKIIQAEGLAGCISVRMIPPTPPAAASQAGPGTPQHIVFVLEEADKRMDALCQRLEHLSRLL